MQKFLITAAVTLVTAGGALAADLPSRKAEPTPPPPIWSGFYAGLNAGYGFGTNRDFSSQNISFGSNLINFVQVTDAGVTAMNGSHGLSQNGFLGGGQIGYNYQWGTKFVLGIEADIQGSGILGSSQTATAGHSKDTLGIFAVEQNSIGSTSVDAGLDYLGTVRGRIGYLIQPNMLVYGTGGFAYGEAYSHVTQVAFNQMTATVNGAAVSSWTNICFGSARQSQMLTGWTAGGGFEWMFMPNWSLKAEGLYWDLGSMTVRSNPWGEEQTTLAVSSTVSGTGATNVSYSGVAARTGLNYHFTW